MAPKTSVGLNLQEGAVCTSRGFSWVNTVSVHLGETDGELYPRHPVETVFNKVQVTQHEQQQLAVDFLQCSATVAPHLAEWFLGLYLSPFHRTAGLNGTNNSAKVETSPSEDKGLFIGQSWTMHLHNTSQCRLHHRLCIVLTFWWGNLKVKQHGTSSHILGVKGETNFLDCLF